VIVRNSQTQREIDPVTWNSKAGRTTATKKEETRQLNSFLETIQAQIHKAPRELYHILPCTQVAMHKKAPGLHRRLVAG
jgi:hypothetical protein